MFENTKIVLRYKNLKTNIGHIEIITHYVDKASSNFAFICKAYYVQQLDLYLGANKIFQPLKDNIAVVSKKILALYKLCKLKVKNLNFPYITLVPKVPQKSYKLQNNYLWFVQYTLQ